MEADTGTEVTARLTALNERVVACEACPRLVAWRNEVATAPPRAFAGQEYWAKPLPGFGDLAARLVIVGLAPAAHGGNRTGRMFTGDRSGDFLVARLHEAGLANKAHSASLDDGLQLLDAYMTAPVRCAPPDNRPLPAERECCAPFLKEELALLVTARVYLALGAFAFDSLKRITGFEALRRSKFRHGAEVALDEDGERVVLCSYHPSQRNVFTGLLTAEMFDSVLARARVLLNQDGPRVVQPPPGARARRPGGVSKATAVNMSVERDD